MNSITTKVIIVSVIILALIIPLQMVKSLIKERQERRTLLFNEMGNIWGGDHRLTGPFILKNKKYVSPENLTLECDIQSEIRRKGIYKIPFYTGTIKIKGYYKAAKIRSGINKIIMMVTDKKSIEITKFTWCNRRIDFYDTSNAGDRIAISIPGSRNQSKCYFEIDLKLQGTDKFHLLPFSKKTKVYLTSNWPHPNFTGAYLPSKREINKNGFKAYWELINTQNIVKNKSLSSIISYIEDLSFGVNLFLPVDIYHKTERAVKYSILFLVLTFLLFFLFELFNAIRIHPLQYSLIGFSLCLFYLLLLSLSEHIGFFFSYLIATMGTVGTITMYSKKVLQTKIRLITLSTLLVVLYSFLFILLHLEEYTLLIGSITLFFILAGVMYLTKDVNWYNIPTVSTKKIAKG